MNVHLPVQSARGRPLRISKLEGAVVKHNGQFVPHSGPWDRLSCVEAVLEIWTALRGQLSASFTAGNDSNERTSDLPDLQPQFVENLSTCMSGDRSKAARAFIVCLALAGSAFLVLGFAHWQTSDPVKFVCYLIAALLASSLKVGLPGIEGTLSVNFLFTLLGILELNLPETLAIGVASTLAQFYWKPARQIKPVQLVFNLSQVTVSSAIAYGAYQAVVHHILHGPGPLALLVAAIVHFACNTAATSTIIGLTEEK